MDRDWRVELLHSNRYEDIFKDTYLFDPPLGWQALVTNLVQYIDWHNRLHRSDVSVYSCTKANGGLQFILDTNGKSREGLEEIYGAIQFAESMSNSICEKCGNAAELRKIRHGDDLILTTFCAEHFKDVSKD
jgi:hypothetical protein